MKLLSLKSVNYGLIVWPIVMGLGCKDEGKNKKNETPPVDQFVANAPISTTEVQPSFQIEDTVGTKIKDGRVVVQFKLNGSTPGIWRILCRAGLASEIGSETFADCDPAIGYEITQIKSEQTYAFEVQAQNPMTGEVVARQSIEFGVGPSGMNSDKISVEGQEQLQDPNFPGAVELEFTAIGGSGHFGCTLDGRPLNCAEGRTIIRKDALKDGAHQLVIRMGQTEAQSIAFCTGPDCAVSQIFPRSIADESGAIRLGNRFEVMVPAGMYLRSWSTTYKSYGANINMVDLVNRQDVHPVFLEGCNEFNLINVEGFQYCVRSEPRVNEAGLKIFWDATRAFNHVFMASLDDSETYLINHLSLSEAGEIQRVAEITRNYCGDSLLQPIVSDVILGDLIKNPVGPEFLEPALVNSCYSEYNEEWLFIIHTSTFAGNERLEIIATLGGPQGLSSRRPELQYLRQRLTEILTKYDSYYPAYSQPY